MSISTDESDQIERARLARDELAERWESDLRLLDLGYYDILLGSSDELEASLERIDELLEDMSALPTFWVDVIRSDPASIWDSEETAPPYATVVTPEQTLLTRRSLILDRLQMAKKEESAALSLEHAESSLDDAQRESIEGKLDELNEEQARLEKLRSETESRREREAVERQLKIARFELEAEEKRAEIETRVQQALAEQKSRLWQTRLGRDSIAAIVGGVLLIGFAIAVIVAMFTGTTTTDVVQNSFLLILGYFFGAAVSSRPTSAAAADTLEREAELVVPHP